MAPTRRAFLTSLALSPAALSLTVPARAQDRSLGRVDVALMLAVDASASIDPRLLDFQLRGHAAAFRDPAVAGAVGDGRSRAIGVMLAQFAGPETLTTLVPWRRLHSPQDCSDFAAAIDAVPGVAMGGATALGDAVVQAVALLDRAPFETEKRTLDIVSNGFSNAGVDPRSARGYAASANVGINALAILNEYDWLEDYYANQLITGQGAFVRSADKLESFAASFLGKLVTEIA